MIRNHIISGLLLLAIIIFFLAPFFHIMNFMFLTGDDFCRAVTEPSEYIQQIRIWFQEHNGRFVNAHLSYLPIYELETYRWSLKFIFLISLSTLFYTVHQVLKIFGFQISSLKTALITAVFMVAIISFIPSVFEYFFWYAGATSYQLSIAAFLLLLPGLLKMYFGEDFNFPLLSLLCVFILGNQEMLMLFLNFILFSLLLYRWKLNDSRRFQILYLNIISWTASLIVFFLPGSMVRRENNPGGGDILISIYKPLEFLVKTTGKAFANWPQIFIIAAFILFLLQINKKKGNWKHFQPKILLLFSLLGFLSVAFVPVYAMGNIGRNRVTDLIHIFYLLLLFLNLINYAVYMRSKKARIKIYPRLHKLLLPIGLVLMIFFNTNFKSIYHDYRNSGYAHFEKQKLKRYSNLKEAEPEAAIIIEPIDAPALFPYMDITEDPYDWHNQCLMLYVNKKLGTEVKTLTIKK